ncbi:Chromatin assembly factor 1 subunit p50 [Castilleja foliolosa]|uniref:Chromatin assembly factor 1 subunit p50 n=1 Tax=Castilleja foliolosa TaxID=1961234 RepID=A0ABD3BZ59_9LAMI
MIEKLKREIEYEYDEASKALGIEGKILMVREEAAKGRNLTDQLEDSAVKEKIEHLKDEFREILPTSPNYPRLISKLQMLEELTKSQKSTVNKDELKSEINKRLSELVDRADVKNKIETLKAEIGNPAQRKSCSCIHRVVLTNPKAVTKINAFGEEVTMVIDDVVKSSDLKVKIELLKTMVAKGGDDPDEEMKSKIQVMVAEIKKDISEAISVPELKERHERLAAELLEDNNASFGSNGSVNLEANSSFV